MSDTLKPFISRLPLPPGWAALSRCLASLRSLRRGVVSRVAFLVGYRFKRPIPGTNRPVRAAHLKYAAP